MIRLPDPLEEKGGMLTQAMTLRKSVRRFSDRQLSLEQVSYILWACQGRRQPGGRSEGRTVPSAGATYPLEVFFVCGDRCVAGLETGTYAYLPDHHALDQTSRADVRPQLAAACLSQKCVAEAPASVVIGADYARTGSVYGERGVRYVHIEAGHAGQNVCLACAVLGLGTVAVGAFNDESVARTLELPLRVDPIYVMPVGRPKS